MFYGGNILRRKNIRECVEKLRPPDVGLRKLQHATKFH
jgi:hypothetical protein